MQIAAKKTSTVTASAPYRPLNENSKTTRASSFNIPADLWDYLAQRKAQDGVPMIETLRRAVREYCERHPVTD